MSSALSEYFYVLSEYLNLSLKQLSFREFRKQTTGRRNTPGDLTLIRDNQGRKVIPLNGLKPSSDSGHLTRVKAV